VSADYRSFSKGTTVKHTGHLKFSRQVDFPEMLEFSQPWNKMQWWLEGWLKVTVLEVLNLGSE